MSCYKFPKSYELKTRLKDVLEPQVDEKYYLSEEIQKRFVYNQSDDRIKEKLPKGKEIIINGTTQNSDAMGTNCRHWVHDEKGIMGALSATDYKQPKQILIKNATKQGYLEAIDGDGIDLNYPDSETRRGRVQPQQAHTLTTSGEYGVIEVERTPLKFLGRNGKKTDGDYSFCVDTAHTGGVKEIYEDNFKIRKLTPLECWRLMDVSDEDFNKVKDAGISDSQLYKLAGNSIVTNVLVEIFGELFKEETR